MKIYFMCIIIATLVAGDNSFPITTLSQGNAWSKMLKIVGNNNVGLTGKSLVDNLKTISSGLFNVTGDDTPPLSEGDAWNKTASGLTNTQRNMTSNGKEALDNLKTNTSGLFSVTSGSDDNSTATTFSEGNSLTKLLRSAGTVASSVGEAKDNLRSIVSGYLSSLEAHNASSAGNIINVTSTGDKVIGNGTSRVSGLFKILDQPNAVSSSILRHAVNVSSNGEEAINKIKSTVSGLFSDLQQRDTVSTSLIGNATTILHSVTKNLQNAVTIASGTPSGALGTVRFIANTCIAVLSNMVDQVTEMIAKIIGLDLDKGVLVFINSAIKDGIFTIQNLITDVIDCPIDRVKSLTHKVTDFIGAPTEAINLVDTTIQDLTFCKNSNSSIFSRAICVLKTAFTAQWLALILVIETVVRIFTTVIEVSSLGETLSICLTTTLAPLLNVGKIISNISTRSVSSFV